MSEPIDNAPVIVVTSTAPGSARTLTLAALAAGFREEGLAVSVVTVVRTGAEADGLLRIDDLIDVPTVDLVHLTTRLPPLAAARETGARLPTVISHASRVAMFARDPDIDVVLVDDTEGLLTPLDHDGATMLDLADLLEGLSLRVGIVLACTPARDAVDAICLRAQALAARDLDALGIVGAAWPGSSDAAGVVDTAGAFVGGDAAGDLASAIEDGAPEASGLPWLGTVPAAAAAWTKEEFTARAGEWLPFT